jgi:hypothetical protein
VSDRKPLTTVVDERFPPESCETCRFWLPNETHPRSFGHCRRYPPILLPNTVMSFTVEALGEEFDNVDEYADTEKDSSIAWGHPVRSPDEWCGEYSPRIKPA